MSLLALLFATALATEVDEIGSDASDSDEGAELKVVAIHTGDELAVVTKLEFGVQRDTGAGAIHFVLYHRAAQGEPWKLVDSEALTPTPGITDDPVWAASGTLSWVLQPDSDYAIGAWLGNGWTYFYNWRDVESPWFGEVTGSMRMEAAPVPAQMRAEQESYYYWMRITSEAGDADGDGQVDAAYGGTDCDDGDPLIPAAEDACGDGIDQDCSGADADCDDTDVATETDPGGGDDTDVTSTDTTGGTDDGATDDDDGTGGIRVAACSCGPDASPAGGLVALGALLVARRRRRLR